MPWFFFGRQCLLDAHSACERHVDRPLNSNVDDLLFIFFFFLLFRAIPMTCGGSQARGQIRAKLPAYATATAVQDLSHVCDLYHSSWQRWILNPLSEARDRTCGFMDTSQTCFCWATTGAPEMGFDQNFRMMWNGWWMPKSGLQTYLFLIQKGNWDKLVLTQLLEKTVWK